MKTGILSSILFLLCAMVLFSCQEKTQYFETAGSLHTPYHIKYSYTKALDKEIQEALRGYYHSINPFRNCDPVRSPDAAAAAEVVRLVYLSHRRLLRSAEPDAVLPDRSGRLERDRQLLGGVRGVLRFHGIGDIPVLARAQAS